MSSHKPLVTVNAAQIVLAGGGREAQTNGKALHPFSSICLTITEHVSHQVFALAVAGSEPNTRNIQAKVAFVIAVSRAVVSAV
jgi:hypothetical protein